MVGGRGATGCCRHAFFVFVLVLNCVVLLLFLRELFFGRGCLLMSDDFSLDIDFPVIPAPTPAGAGGLDLSIDGLTFDDDGTGVEVEDEGFDEVPATTDNIDDVLDILDTYGDIGGDDTSGNNGSVGGVGAGGRGGSSAASIAIHGRSSVSIGGDHLDDLVDNDYPFASGVDMGDGKDDDDYFNGLSGRRESVSIDDILSDAIVRGASDVHINPDSYVSFTILGEIVHIKEYGVIPDNMTKRMYTSITSHMSQATFASDLELDTSYTIKQGGYKGRRFRLSVGYSYGCVFMVFRVINDIIPTPEDLGIPEALKKWVQLPNGLVLICGPTGTGKSTTFASLVNQINRQQTKKIITVERPIEYVYPRDGRGLITQREVGRDARSFHSALTSAMRQAPDVIMIGEVRNREEVDSLLQASESGHLSFSTMHTNTPPSTINRIKSLYTGDEQLRVLSSLKDNIRGIANQVLLKTLDGRGRFAVHCVLVVEGEVADMIGEGDVSAIQEHMLTQRTTMEHQLAKAVVGKRCTVDTARAQCVHPELFDDILREKK